MFIAFSLLISSVITHSDISSFKDMVFARPNDAIDVYPDYAKKIANDSSEGAMAIYRLAMLAAIRTQRIDLLPAITSEMTSARFDKLSGDVKANALLMLGGAYLLRDELTQSLWHFECARQLTTIRDTHVKIDINTAIILTKQKKFKEAFFLLSTIKDEEFGTRGMGVKRMIEANILFYEHRFDEAIKAYQHAYAFYRKDDDMNGAVRVIQNILLASVIEKDWLSFDRYYDVLLDVKAQFVSDNNNGWISLLFLTKQYQQQALTKAEYLDKASRLLPSINEEHFDEVRELGELLDIDFKLDKQAFADMPIPDYLGKAWCKN